MADMRISGLASGMDIDEIVTNLMNAERIPLDKVQQKKTYTEWQRDDYRTMNTALSELDTLIFEGVGKQASFNKKNVTVSNENAISVKNVNSTSDFSGTVSVSNLASAATMVSTAENTDIESAKQKLSELTPNTVGQTITIKAINKDGGYDKEKNADGTDSTEDKVFSYTITEDDTLESVINKINADSGVTVFFDENSKQFSITAKNTGDAKTSAGDDVPEIVLGAVAEDGTVIADGDTFFTQIMKMSANNVDAASVNIGTVEDPIMAGTVGQNANLTYNGLSIERASNKFTINGAEITLKQATTSPVTFSSSSDVDTIYDTIKNFVDSYNGLIANISDKTSERKSRDYAPLTDTQKKAMSDDEVEQWEAIAKKGTLSRDSTLSSLLTKMRTSIYTSVSDTSFGSLAKIGVSTTSNYLEGGKLEIDENTLRAAIEEDPNGVYQLFMGGSSSSPTSEQGVARRLRTDLKAAMTDISTKAGKASSINNTFTIGRLLNNYEDKISAFEERMAAVEDRYYRQFTAMEKAIQKANQQSSYLMQNFFS
ncbi:flagellar hook-associated protein 2 [Bacillus sp. V3B]|uniref:flagellar hook-associated protein 2 n=1 Tax=Bacillus sp. V3B TaxID=2804915 RepID=UPI00210B65F3|nr:flagellar hook-associated protein 2 [Bacillus sp. V3B]MCQ6277157.1 flagellar hook-associated protein 2 [Bacillus sp. V3B]